MAQLTIRKVDDDLVRRLRSRAAANNRSAEAELRVILEDVLRPLDAGAWRARAVELARRHARHDSTDSATLLREARDERTEQILDAVSRRR